MPSRFFVDESLSHAKLSAPRPTRCAFPTLKSPIHQRLDQIDAELRSLLADFVQVAKAKERGATINDDEVNAKRRRFESLQSEFRVTLDLFQAEIGLSDEQVAELEASRAPSEDDRTWWSEMVTVPTTLTMDDYLPGALDALAAFADPAWLRSETAKVLRLDPREGLELVGGTRVDRRPIQPHRFAQMLAVTRQHIERRNDLDIFAATALVPELLALGTRLDAVRALGPEATGKLARLQSLPFEDVAATIFELHVGTALILEGRSATMLAPDGSAKTPDFTVDDLHGIPFVVECKRRVGLTGYEKTEADLVNALYAPVRARLARDKISVRLDVEFIEEVAQVSAADFENLVAVALSRGHSAGGWGNVLARELPSNIDIEPTRLYSPDMLSSAFEWSFEAGDWDGLIADVDADDCLVDQVRMPRALRWRSRSDNASTKKARGLTSLFAKAAEQVRAGEAGVIYIGYNEAGADHADARTRHTLDAIRRREWHHKSLRQIPLVIASRFLAAPRGGGVPDMIESCLLLVETGWETAARSFPAPVLTRRV